MRNAAREPAPARLKLVKNGAATLVLTNNDNSFTGGTTVNGGTLQIGDGNNYGVLPAAGGVVVNSGGTLFFNRNDGYGYGGTITGSGTVKIYQGNGGSSFGTGYNTSLTGFGGTTNVLSGVAYLRSANGLGTGSYNIGNGATLLLWTSHDHDVLRSRSRSTASAAQRRLRQARHLWRRRLGNLYALRPNHAGGHQRHRQLRRQRHDDR